MKLNEIEPRKILESVIAERIPAILSYTSRDKWHATDVLPVRIAANSLYFEISSHKKVYPMNITVGQQVGISLKYDYGKLLFEANILSLEPSPNQAGGGIVVVGIPTSIKTVSRRNYFRVTVPKAMEVDVLIKRHGQFGKEEDEQSNWQGELIDISAGGLQVGIDVDQKPNFKEGQFLNLEFSPVHGEPALKFRALVRCLLPSADEKSVCVGMQMVGLEASVEGREVVQRICQVVEFYHRMNHSQDRQWSFLDGN